MESINKNNLCRLCLLNSESLYYIFEINNMHGYLAAEVIEDLLQLEVSERDAYPHFVCEKCLEKLTEFKQFKNQCHISKATYDNVFSVEDNLLGDEDYRNSRSPLGLTIAKVESVTKMGNEDEQSQMNIHSMNLDEEEVIPDEISDNDGYSPIPLELVEVTTANGSQNQIDATSESVDECDAEPLMEDMASDPTHHGYRIRINSKVAYDYENRWESGTISRNRGDPSGSATLGDSRNTFANAKESNGRISSSCGCANDKECTCNGTAERIEEGGLGAADDFSAETENSGRIFREGAFFSCGFCGRNFFDQTQLDRHLLIHSGEKPFGCEICGKTFTHRSNFELHMRFHRNIRPFECKCCGKRFTQKSNLTSHFRTHSGEKPFSCEVCGKGFGQKGNLELHKRTHSGEKPYTCKVCNKSFSQSGSLKSHLRIHSGEKPYCCSLCGKGFTNKATLDYHLRAHYGDKPFSCDKCDKKFAGKQNLAMHMKIHGRE